MRVVRAIRNLRTRNPKKRPTTGTVTIVRDGIEEDVDLPLAEFPVGLHFQMFAPPTVLGGEKVSGITLLTHESPFIQFGGPQMEEVKEKLEAEQIWVRQTYKPIEFARMIAKIAYSFAFAVWAGPKSRPTIRKAPHPVLRNSCGKRSGALGELSHRQVELESKLAGRGSERECDLVWRGLGSPRIYKFTPQL